MRKLKLVQLHNMHPCILLLTFLLVICSGCSKEKVIGKWVDSSNGIKVFVPNDFDDKFDETTLVCKNESNEFDGILHYGPVFEITVKDKSGKEHKFKKYLIPSIIPDSLLKVKETGNNNAYWLIAGKRDKKGRTQGYAFELRFTNNDCTKYQYGEFEDDQLTKGFRSTYNPQKDQRVNCLGKFKDDKIYQGYKQVVLGDSIVDFEIGVWEENGSLNKTYLDFCGINDYIYEKLHYTAEQQSEAEADFAKRYFFWQSHKWYFFIGLSILGFIIYFIGIGCIDDDEYYPAKPWRKTTAFKRWLLGPIGFIHIYLRNNLIYYFTILFWVGIVASSKFFVLYGLNPEMWPYLFAFRNGYWQIYLIEPFIIVWIITFFCIPYRIYKLNFLHYRHNIYEDLINKGQTLEYEHLCKEIPKTVAKDAPIVERILDESAWIYDEELGVLSKTFSFLTNSKVQHAREKAEKLNDCYKELTTIAERERKLTMKLTHLLDIERRNAYRNMILAKELVFLIKKAKHKKQTLKRDIIQLPHIDNPTEITRYGGPEIDYQTISDNAFDVLDSTFSTLKNIGIEDKDNFLLSLGAAIVTAGVETVINENSIRTQQRLHYERISSDIINSMIEIRNDLLATHGKMMRAQEILKALSEVNVIFVQAYNPLRDYIFGCKPTFIGYIQHTFGRNKKKAINIVDDIAYLVAICNDYNKINQSAL